MENNRIAALRGMLAQDPANSFARYGVAMELLNTGELEEASREFRSLIETKPDYVAAYYHGGQAFERLGLIENARMTYQEGIEACIKAGDTHTEAEIRIALDLLA